MRTLQRIGLPISASKSGSFLLFPRIKSCIPGDSLPHSIIRCEVRIWHERHQNIHSPRNLPDALPVVEPGKGADQCAENFNLAVHQVNCRVCHWNQQAQQRRVVLLGVSKAGGLRPEVRMAQKKDQIISDNRKRES